MQATLCRGRRRSPRSDRFPSFLEKIADGRIAIAHRRSPETVRIPPPLPPEHKRACRDCRLREGPRGYTLLRRNADLFATVTFRQRVAMIGAPQPSPRRSLKAATLPPRSHSSRARHVAARQAVAV